MVKKFSQNKSSSVESSEYVSVSYSIDFDFKKLWIACLNGLPSVGSSSEEIMSDYSILLSVSWLNTVNWWAREVVDIELSYFKESCNGDCGPFNFGGGGGGILVSMGTTSLGLGI